MAKVLIVAADETLRAVLKRLLTTDGHEVQLVRTATEGARLARTRRPDLILVDLPVAEGTNGDVLGAFFSDPSIDPPRMVAVSAAQSEPDRVRAFEAGVDDYVAKPFSPRELALRVRAVLRRGQRPGQPRPPADDVVIDVPAHRAWVAGRELQLTPIEFRILRRLSEQPHKVVTRAALTRAVWEDPPADSSRAIDTHVNRLRQKLGPAAEWVHTVRGVGFRFDRPGR